MKKFVILLFAACLFAACSTEDDGGEIILDPIVFCDIIEVSGKIDAPTVWEEGFVYVIEGSDLRVESVLTIQPGAIIKIRDARISIFEEGKIIAEGTAEKRIVFTSLADDRYCGDTNGDAVASQPEKGDWISLDLHGTVGSVFKYVDVFYAGQTSGGTNIAVNIDWEQSASFTFDNCRIAHTLYTPNHSSSYAFYGTEAMRDASVSKFTNNALYDNGRPIHFYAFYQLDSSNVFHNPEDPAQINTHNGIYITRSSGGQNLSVDLNNTEVPYVSLSVSHLSGFASSTINIQPNVILKFSNPSGGLTSNNGNIQLDPSAILTSYKDDANGGDTNGDGNATAPAAGDWEGFWNTDGGTTYYWEQGANILYSAN